MEANPAPKSSTAPSPQAINAGSSLSFNAAGRVIALVCTTLAGVMDIRFLRKAMTAAWARRVCLYREEIQVREGCEARRPVRIQTDQALRRSPPVSPTAIQTCFTATGWFPGWRVGVPVEHSWTGAFPCLRTVASCLSFDSLTVAGAAPALPSQAERRTGFPFKYANDGLHIPEADYGRSIGLAQDNCKMIMSCRAKLRPCEALAAHGILCNDRRAIDFRIRP